MKRRTTNTQPTRVRSLEQLESRTLLAADLVISEINYNPYGQAFDDISDNNDDYEFIELHNTGSETLNLEGVKFVRLEIGGETEGIDFVFGQETLAPDERVVIVEDMAAFESRYGTNVRVAGVWSGGLNNGAETLTLQDANDELIVQMTYRSGGKWPSRPDGIGATLEYPDQNTPPEELDQDDPDSWQSSVEFGGTPGQAPGDRTPNVIFNEILAHTDTPQIDIIEFYNPTSEAVDVSGWFLTENIETPFIFSIPEGSVIPADGYLFVDETDFNPGSGSLPTDFALSERGEELWLISDDGNGGPGLFRDRVNFGATLNGVSVGNVPNGNTSGDLQPLAELTFGEANTGHRVSEIVVTEIQYHPVSDLVVHEFVEIQNTTVFAITLDNWRISDAVDVRVPTNTVLQGGDTLVLVSFDPADQAMANEFRSYYGIDETVRLVGPWGSDDSGDPDTLSNTGEKVTLRQAFVDTDLTSLFVAVDQVDYNDKAPWPVAADGRGGSLGRISPEDYGNDSASWRAVTPSPGNAPFEMSVSPIDASTPLNGEIGMDGETLVGSSDVDVFQFTPTADGEFTINVTGSEFETTEGVTQTTDPFLRIFNAGDEIAFNDNLSVDSTDSRVVVDLTGGEDYLIVVSGSSATEDPRSYDPFTGSGLADGSIGPYSVSIETGEPVDTTPYQNSVNPLDVDANGLVIPFDVLLVINALNSQESPDLPTPSEPVTSFVDVNGDNSLTPFDALLIINFLNSNNAQIAAVPANRPSATRSLVSDDNVAGADLSRVQLSAASTLGENDPHDASDRKSLPSWGTSDVATHRSTLSVATVDLLFAR